MSEQDKQQLGDGSTNYADAAQKTAKAIKEAGKAAAEKRRPLRARLPPTPPPPLHRQA